MTQRLYYENAFLQEFTATVVSCEPEKSGFAVVLDRTAFYPEGGGQPGDRGTLGGVNVTDTRERGGEVVHLCDGPLEPGTTVEGKLDWLRRHDHMQQHSGEHLVSGLICYVYHCDNVGFHMGAETVTIDFNHSIPSDALPLLEEAANVKLWQGLPIVVSHPTPEELEGLDYRSKKELSGDVRIVTIPGADCCACCGTHLRQTSEIGLVKLLSIKPFREGVRIEMVAGDRAYRYFRAVCEQNHAISVALSAKERETAAAVERLKGELADARYRLVGVENRLFDALAASHAREPFALVFEEGLSPDALRRLCERLAAVCSDGAAVFTGADGEGWRYAVKLPPERVKAMNAALKGRGGGRDGFAQGSVGAGRAEIEAFFQ